jgi:hypothetical protein
MKFFAVLPASLALIAAAPAPFPSEPYAQLRQIVAPVSGAELKKNVEALVGFGTRHTLSSPTDPKRGIGAALSWAESRFKSFGLETIRPCDTVTGRRVPGPTRVCDMVAIQRGTERPNDVVIITGHIDSRVSDVMNSTSDAPGANDDGSGTAAVIEAARVLSKHEFPGTIVYAALSGEEQGLLGATILANHAKAKGWNVVADLNNDIIGNSCGSDGMCDAAHVRVLSEGPRSQGQAELAEALHSLGGENDSPSRNISRFLDGLADNLNIGLDVRQIWRTDRFGRGGDHIPFLELGYPAARVTVAVENYDAQHQDLRTENGRRYGDTIDRMDFAYLEKVTKLNVAALAAIASAPAPPEPKAEGAVSTDTTLRWKLIQPLPDHFIIHWRRTDANQWQHDQAIFVGAGPELAQIKCAGSVKDGAGQLVGQDCSTEIVLPHIRVDDWVFGVSSVSKDGWESPVASAVPGGALKPYVPPEKK